MTATSSVVDLSYADLLDESKDLSSLIEQAYGPTGLGVLTVSNVPQYKELRDALLPLSHNFATLPEEIKDTYVDAKSNFSFGWSHGKESFNGKPDTLKGSYYANPQYDSVTTDENLIEKFPFYCRPNIWPSQEHVPNFETAFKQLGQLIVSVGLLVARACDKYVKTVSPTYQDEHLKNTIAESKTTKARLLYYFPTKVNQEGLVEYNEDNLDSWCGWHLDHGSLTGLTLAIYQDENGNLVENQDKRAGLYIRTRAGDVVKAVWRADQLAFQIGESAQIHSGGKLVATPHCVRGSSIPGISRSTLAVFMQPQWDKPMSPPEGVAIKECSIDVLEQDMDFNHFTEKRLAQYYDKM